MPKDVSISEEDVNRFIEVVEFFKKGEKTTVCFATLRNGFELVTSSACVVPENYDSAVGERIAYEKMVSKVWELMGYELQHKEWMRGDNR